MIALRILIFILGLGLVALTVLSAVKTFVLPRATNDPLTKFVFVNIRRVFNLLLRRARNYAQVDRLMAFYAPVSLFMLLPTWLFLVDIGFTAMIWAVEGGSLYDAYLVSGSSLLTLGFASSDNLPTTIIGFAEATIGLMLVALLIAYLPSMYSAFSRRESTVSMLEVRAGSPPFAVEMIARYQRIHGLNRLSQQWETWEAWFTDIEESHTSLAALVFFRSPKPEHSWVTAAGTVLDAAALVRSSVEMPPDPRADLCIRAGYLALRHIADYFGYEYNPDPHYPNQSISVTREEYDRGMEIMASAGVRLREDREQAWRDFAGWRVNYDQVLLELARLTLAPDAPWLCKDRLPAE